MAGPSPRSGSAREFHKVLALSLGNGPPYPTLKAFALVQYSSIKLQERRSETVVSTRGVQILKLRAGFPPPLPSSKDHPTHLFQWYVKQNICGIGHD